MTNPTYQQYQCDSDFVDDYPGSQGRGVTTWNLSNGYTVPLLMPVGSLNDTATLTFTCTVPKCYSYDNGTISDGTGTHTLMGRDSCNVVFNAWTNDTISLGSDIWLEYSLNGYPTSGCRISGVATHGATQAFELAPIACYNDMYTNTFTIHNTSNSTIHIDHFKIYRTYKICNLYAEQSGGCTNPEAPCHPGNTAGTSGNLDSWRVDTPCNYENCGGLSFTQVHDNYYEGSILPKNNGELAWTFDFSTLSGYNYQGKSICLFNFNQVWPTDSTDANDIALVAKLNGNIINTYYISRVQQHGLFPTYDLAQSNWYNDAGSNTVTLVNTGTVDVQMSTAEGDHGVDIYRIFQTAPVCQSPCQVGCEVSCQSACQAACQIPCYYCQGCYSCYTCQTQCNVTCQTGCEISCQTGCEVACQSCNTCQTACELACQTGCQVSCQTGCEVSCQTGCEVSCQTTCEVSCQTGCEVSCQLGCQVSCQQYYCAYCQTCQLACEQSCQTACQVGCQTACELSCQDCQTTCETICNNCQQCVICQTGNTCPPMYYTCQQCEFCYGVYT